MNKLGAVIVAAGCSRRMRSFKPMLRLGDSTVIRTAITNIIACGAQPVVIVLGKNSDTMAEHIGDLGVKIVYNLDYAHTDMFYSAKMGMSAVKDKCERCLFLPADIPLFSPQSVAAMNAYMDDHACAIVTPAYQGRRGHPLLFKTSIIDKLLLYEGKQGLRGAIAACGSENVVLEVPDAGMLLDIDRPEDYRNLRQYAASLSPAAPEDAGGQAAWEKVSRHTLEEILDEDMIALLRQTDSFNSLATACKMTGISYSAGWKKIKFAESQLGFPLVESSRGGQGGGNTCLTADAVNLLNVYSKYLAAVRKYKNKQFARFFGGNGPRT